MCCAALFALLSSCSVDTPVRRDESRIVSPRPGLTASIIVMIHGDGGYQYQEAGGETVSADESAVARAVSLAVGNPSAEVFIFHQKPRRTVLWMFPRSDGECRIYRNGRLSTVEDYDRSDGPDRFAAETALYERHARGREQSRLSVFLYSGHEIPEAGGAGYDSSVPERSFTVGDLVSAMRRMAPPSGRFDLAILATCYGGTPVTVGLVGSVARTIVASPDNLHLSSFDLRSLEGLDPLAWNGDTPALARSFARAAFERLVDDVQTAVSVVVYDIDRLQPYLRSIEAVAESSRRRVDDRLDPLMARCDCAAIPAYALPGMEDGVEVLFRPARFGRMAHQRSHSGWGCQTEPGSARHDPQSPTDAP